MEFSGNFRKLRKRLRHVYEKLKRLMKIFENLWQSSVQNGFRILVKSSGVFGNFRRFSENFGNGSKVFFRWFYDFLKFLENLRKCSEILGNFWKTSETVQECFSDDFMIF